MLVATERLRARVRKRLEMDAPFGAWGTQTFIAGLTQDNLIAPWVIKGAMDGEAFEAFVRTVLAPELRPGSVVIYDKPYHPLQSGGCRGLARYKVLVSLPATVLA